jgi:phosphoribosylformylglycinamidine synthase
MTTDCTPRYCYADPYEGGKQAVAEAYRNLCAVGAKPLAITNCLNFGNPQRPEIMAQIVHCLEGMADACRALDFPIVSGNVSLYNESKATGGGSAILPTPAIGGVGLLEDWQKSATIGFKAADQEIYVLGEDPNYLALGCSLYLQVCHGRTEGVPLSVDLEQERRRGELVRRLIDEQLITAAHDVSDGGALVALAEMALAGNLGCEVYTNWSDGPMDYFGESQGRYILTTSSPEQLQKLCKDEGITCYPWGRVTDDKQLQLSDYDVTSVNALKIPLADLRAAHEGFFPKLMGADAALA